MAVNPLFFLATATFGWGLSLLTYRLVASRYGWPMGEPQARHPLFVMLLGLAALVISILFAIQSQPNPTQHGFNIAGWSILGLGILFAWFWTGFLRVASQTALFLAPIAAFMLVLGWASTDDIGSDLRSMKDRLVEWEKRTQTRIEDGIQRRRALKGEPGYVPEGSNDPAVPPKVFQPQ
jgi:hypothetical protein